MDAETDHGERLDEPLRLRMILGRIRGELIDLGRCADGLQVAIGAIVTNSPSPLDLGAQVRLQAADALSQRLERLAQLAGALEAKVPDGWALDADAKSHVASALARVTEPGCVTEDRAPQDEGDCEIF